MGKAFIDHITFGVSEFGRSAAFYDRALAPLFDKLRVQGGFAHDSENLAFTHAD